jgi:hypothetical protein
VCFSECFSILFNATLFHCHEHTPTHTTLVMLVLDSRFMFFCGLSVLISVNVLDICYEFFLSLRSIKWEVCNIHVFFKHYYFFFISIP